MAGTTIKISAPRPTPTLAQTRLSFRTGNGVDLSAIHPKITFLEQTDRHLLPDDFVRDIEHWKTRSGVVKINLALSELPDFIADPGEPPDE